MFEFIYDRGFNRNKKMLAKLGLGYSKEQHATYKDKLEQKNIKPFSVEGLLRDKNLFEPVSPCRCSFVTFHQSEDGDGYRMIPAEEEQVANAVNKSRAQRHTDAHQPDVTYAVNALSETIALPLTVTFEENTRTVTLREKAGKDGYRDVAYVPQNIWKLIWVGEGRRATID